MEFIIIDERSEKLVVKPGENDTAVIVHKLLYCQAEPWITKVIILNRREAWLIQKAITDILLQPDRTYKVLPT